MKMYDRNKMSWQEIRVISLTALAVATMFAYSCFAYKRAEPVKNTPPSQLERKVEK